MVKDLLSGFHTHKTTCQARAHVLLDELRLALWLVRRARRARSLREHHGVAGNVHCTQTATGSYHRSTSIGSPGTCCDCMW